MIRIIYEYIKIRFFLNKLYRKTDVLDKFSKTFNNKFKVDWFGSMYTVITPGDLDNNLIYSYDENGMNPLEHFRKMILERLIVCEKYLQQSNILDILSCDIKLIDKQHNIYLLIIQPYNLPIFKKTMYKFFKYFGILGLIISTYFLFF